SAAAMSATSVPTSAPDCSRSRAAAFSSDSAWRPAMTTRWSVASRAATAKPMPTAPPPTRAVRALMVTSQGLVHRVVSCSVRYLA
ncbi:MAG: hypothetical protein QOG28_6529, partial [Trebonia sp.]|nr:hypothetical protein [Trebonia sp.]